MHMDFGLKLEGRDQASMGAAIPLPRGRMI